MTEPKHNEIRTVPRRKILALVADGVEHLSLDWNASVPHLNHQRCGVRRFEKSAAEDAMHLHGGADDGEGLRVVDLGFRDSHAGHGSTKRARWSVAGNSESREIAVGGTQFLRGVVWRRQ